MILGGDGAAPVVSSATAADDAATSESAGSKLFGKPFMLDAGWTDLAIVDGEVSSLDAKVDVLLQMEDLIIQGGRLTYSNASQEMRGYRDETKQCKIVQEKSTIYCDEFLHNLETGDMKPSGNVKTVATMKGDQEIEIRAADQQIDRNAETGATTVKLRGDVKINTKGFVPRSKYNEDEGTLIIDGVSIPDKPQ